MIKLSLPAEPAELSKNEEALKSDYKATGRDVWKKDYILKALLQMSNGKCAYSEVKLNANSSYLEVDHFKPKEKYPDDVVKWGNLLPSCKTCNSRKGDWDVVVDPIVNPLVDNPGDHLYIRGCRFYKKDIIGGNTIEALSLNNNSQFVIPRFEIASDICDRLEFIFNELKEPSDTSKVRINHLVWKIIRILEAGLPTETYSAAIATYLLYDSPVYGEMKTYMLSNKLWNEDLEKIDASLYAIALPESR